MDLADSRPLVLESSFYERVVLVLIGTAGLILCLLIGKLHLVVSNYHHHGLLLATGGVCLIVMNLTLLSYGLAALPPGSSQMIFSRDGIVVRFLYRDRIVSWERVQWIQIFCSHSNLSPIIWIGVSQPSRWRSKRIFQFFHLDRDVSPDEFRKLVRNIIPVAHLDRIKGL
jgi:hypothetical protein